MNQPFDLETELRQLCNRNDPDGEWLTEECDYDQEGQIERSYYSASLEQVIEQITDWAMEAKS